jgi:hypothetical protein
MTQNQLDDLAIYLPDEEREAAHADDRNDGTPEVYCAIYAGMYGWTSLLEAAALAGCEAAMSALCRDTPSMSPAFAMAD